METSKIEFLCVLSDRLYKNADRANEPAMKEGLRSIAIDSRYSKITIDFDDYPELKPVAEKLCDYLVKSEKSKQNEIKLEIVKLLGK